MNDVNNDKNLREAVSRREQKLPVLPDHLNERVMKRLVETETAPKSRRLWSYAAVAVAAASIALLVLFHLEKQQSPKEPIVAQAIEKEAPSEPPRGEASPLPLEGSGEASEEEVEQPKEKPVTKVSEDAPQPAEPTSTEDVSPLQAPPKREAPPLWEGVGGEAQPFFLTSTSYMVTHRSYRDGLVDIIATDDSDNNGLNLYSVKDKGEMPEGWTELRNWSNGQNARRKLTKKETIQVAVASAIAARQWHIEISSMTTMRYGSRTVTPDFYLELRGDTLRSYLPYLGQAQVSPTLSPSIGLNFEEPVLSYNDGKPKSNKYTQIDIDVRTREDSYHYVIEIYDNGQAYIRVRSMNRDPISFDGKLEIE